MPVITGKMNKVRRITGLILIIATILISKCLIMPFGGRSPGIRVSIGDKVPEKRGSESFGVPSVLKCILYKLVLFWNLADVRRITGLTGDEDKIIRQYFRVK